MLALKPQNDKNYLNQQHKQHEPTTFRSPTPRAARNLIYMVNGTSIPAKTKSPVP